MTGPYVVPRYHHVMVDERPRYPTAKPVVSTGPGPSVKTLMAQAREAQNRIRVIELETQVQELAGRVHHLEAPPTPDVAEPATSEPDTLATDRRDAVSPADVSWLIGRWRDQGWQPS